MAVGQSWQASCQIGKRRNPYKAFAQELFYYMRHISYLGILPKNTSILVFKTRQPIVFGKEMIMVNSISLFRLCKQFTSVNGIKLQPLDK